MDRRRTVTAANQPGTVDQLTALYRQTIVEHAVRPVGFQAEIEPTHRHELYNPLCGDRIEVQLRIAGDDIEAMAFRGEACAICMASASLMCAHQAGRPTRDFQTAHRWLEEALKGGGENSQFEALMPLLGVRAYPSRVRCALLPWEAATQALGRGEGAAPTKTP
jgi:nitrogen fixation NifU-like protein